MKFIDLFAGIGGFHVGLKRLGHTCVFASELSEELRKIYKINHEIDCFGDITKISPDEIPSHDILCGGFPCQSFSKAGNQKGMQEARGKLFDNILNILKVHKPKYIILENVRNLLSHDKGYTWEYIRDSLVHLGYYIDKKILSPHFINIPQHRERIFIVGCLNPNPINKIKWPVKEKYTSCVNDILDNDFSYMLEPDKVKALGVWKEFLDVLPYSVQPYSPLWSMEFGATYPTDEKWEDMLLEEWQQYKGSYGVSLSECKSIEEVRLNLPNYVNKQKGLPPKWKQRYISSNRTFFYNNEIYINKSIIDKIKKLNSESWKKLEWNCKGASKDYLSKLIQFRGSGIRVKRGDYLPSLVTVATQVPIVGDSLRYITPREGARVQSLPAEIILPATQAGSFRVLGNMVNTELVYQVAKALLKNK